MTPEVKVVLRVHEDALGTVPSADAIKALLGFEPSYFLLERETITAQRTRAPRLTGAASLAAQFNGWAEATGLDLPDSRRARLMEKIAGMTA